MKKIFLFFFILSFISFSDIIAQSYKTAIGIRLSSQDAVQNNSISFKQFLNEKMAIEGLLTFDKNIAIGGLVEFHKPINSADGLKWFYGGGAYLGFDSDNSDPDRNLMGLQGVVGLDYKFPSLPINLALDWKPELNIIDNINFEPAAIGFTIRFTFGHK
jgi:hypothetical protein